MKNHLYLAYLLFIVTFGSCAKEGTLSDVDGSAHVATANSLISTFGVPSNDLNWEDIDFMPTPTGMTVPVPWGSTASRQIPEENIHDYKSVDGWELVYNTFNSESLSDHLYFVLYNKFRGILRMYYYTKPTSYITSSNIVHSLQLQGAGKSASPLLNYTQSDVIDISNNLATTSTVEAFQVAPQTWYSFEYELAYDKNISNLNYSALSLLWPIKSNQIQQIVINGTITGTLQDFSFTVPNVNLTTAPSFKGEGHTAVYSSVGAAQAPGGSQNLQNSIIKSIVDGAINLLKGLFGKKKDETEIVKFAINTDINMTGQITSDFSVATPGLAIPGYNQSQTPGVIPAYNQPLGVFYIDNKPSVHVRTDVYHQFDERGNEIFPSRITHTYSITDYDVRYNPELDAFSSIQNEKAEVVVPVNSGTLLSGRDESIGYTGTAVVVEGLTASLPSPPIGVRISFELKPNESTNVVRNVKTFKAGLVEQEIYHYYDGRDPV